MLPRLLFVLLLLSSGVRRLCPRNPPDYCQHRLDHDCGILHHIFIKTSDCIFYQAIFLKDLDDLPSEPPLLDEMRDWKIHLALFMLIGIYGLAAIAALLAIIGTYEEIPSFVKFFAHVFWARFAFDSFACSVLVYHPELGPIGLVGLWVGMLVWHLLGIYLYINLMQLWGELFERTKNRQGLLDILGLWPGYCA